MILNQESNKRVDWWEMLLDRWNYYINIFIISTVQYPFGFFVHEQFSFFSNLLGIFFWDLYKFHYLTVCGRKRLLSLLQFIYIMWKFTSKVFDRTRYRFQLQQAYRQKVKIHELHLWILLSTNLEGSVLTLSLLQWKEQISTKKFMYIIWLPWLDYRIQRVLVWSKMKNDWWEVI